MWAWIIGDRLLGPVLLPQRPNGETYLAFLQNKLSPLLENVPLAKLQCGCSTMERQPTFALMLPKYQEHLSQTLDMTWRLCAWPSRSPDLNPLDFYCGDIWKALYTVSLFLMFRPFKSVFTKRVTLFGHSPEHSNDWGNPWCDVCTRGLHLMEATRTSVVI